MQDRLQRIAKDALAAAATADLLVRCTVMRCVGLMLRLYYFSILPHIHVLDCAREQSGIMRPR